MEKKRFTLPIEAGCENIVTDIIKKWGADAVRNSDGTEMDSFFENLGLKIYATYFPTRNDQEWAKNNRNELQQIYLLSDRFTAKSETLEIDIMQSYFSEQFEIHDEDSPHKYWQVIDRTTDEEVSTSFWSYDSNTKKVIIKEAKLWHVYTVGFLAKQIWDVTQMYNHLTNDWGDKHHEMPYDPAFPKTRAHILEDLESWLVNHPNVNVVRFTSFFYHFTVVYNQHKQQKFGDWFGYSASISVPAIENFKKEFGYDLKSEDIIDQGYYGTAYRVPSPAFKDYMEYQQKFVSDFAKECVDLVHKYKKEAIMFIGDNWIGTEPFGEHFSNIGLDAVVGSTSDGLGIRMISDISDVKYREVRFLPYFFPDLFNDDNDPSIEASEIWIKSRRALMINLLDRMGYGGYLSLAMKYPKFVDTVTLITDQFNDIHNKTENTKVSFLPIKVGILNAWGKIKAWQCNRTGHVSGRKESRPYTGILEALSGMPFDVNFINFEDIKNGVLKDYNVIINMGSRDTAWTGGEYWKDAEVVSKIREWVFNGGAFIGAGAPTACQHNGAFFQLSDILGVDKETENTINFSKRDKLSEKKHFITKHLNIKSIETGFGERGVYATSEQTEILGYDSIEGIQLATHTFGKGRSVYMSGMPYSEINNSIVFRSILWASCNENNTDAVFSDNLFVEGYLYKNKNLIAVLNNSFDTQKAILKLQGKEYKVELSAMKLHWINL